MSWIVGEKFCTLLINGTFMAQVVLGDNDTWSGYDCTKINREGTGPLLVIQNKATAKDAMAAMEGLLK